MNKLFTILSFIALVTSVGAQSPQKMSYQAVIRNNSNALVSSAVVGMQISILQGSASGTVVYTETQTPTTNVDGLVSIKFGGNAGFSIIDWSAGPYFIKTETDPAGGTNYNIVGTSELLSVPYALFSANGTPGPQGLQGPQGIQGVTGTFQNGTMRGEMLYWNGFLWMSIPIGTQSQTLTVCNGLPVWTTNGICPTFSIGDSYGGGIIAYILQSGDPGYIAGEQHGLIAAASDQSVAAIWGCYGITINGADGTAIGTGNQNTLDIINGCSAPDIAAQICYTLVLNGYSDWYLPSKDELNMLYVNHLAIGGFANMSYWSSTEGSNNQWGLGQNFSDGSFYNFGKADTRYVRAIRTF